MDKIELKVHDWKNSNIQVFWGEIAPCDHTVHIYDNDKRFLDTLEGFAGCGFLSGDSVVIIATADHITELNRRLLKQGFDLDSLIALDQYIPLEANVTLSQFMVNDWPDEILFNELISKILSSAKNENRKVRAFGEMVALLWVKRITWSDGSAGTPLESTAQQGIIYTVLCLSQSGFTQNANHSIAEICNQHSKVIDGNDRPSTEIYYRSSVPAA